MLHLDERKIREKTFQDRRFGSDGGSRGRVDRAYAITGASHGDFMGRLASDAPGKRVLEIGCGAGRIAFELAEYGGRVTGIDLSDVAIEAARTRARELGVEAVFEAMDAEKTSLSDASFDIVYGGAILHHLAIDNAYREIARLLAPGGYALFLEPLGYNPFINLYRRLTPALRTPDEHPLLQHDLDLAQEYFRTVRVTYYYLTTLLTLPVAQSKFGKTLIGATNALDRLLFRAIPGLRKQAWFILLELRDPRSSRSVSRIPTARG